MFYIIYHVHIINVYLLVSDESAHYALHVTLIFHEDFELDVHIAFNNTEYIDTSL